MISQDDNQFVFFANNEGLLEFNGSSWKLYPSPNDAIIRSVKVVNDRIYTGSYMDFGYWKRQPTGLLKYYSISNYIKSKILDDEQFWNILNYEQWIVFQSLDRIYIYDSKTGSFKIIAPGSKIVKSFQTETAIYFQTHNQGLYEIEGGKSKLIANSQKLQNNSIVNTFSTEEGLLLVTQSKGFYTLVNDVFTKFTTEIDASLYEGRVYSCEKIADGYCVGTVSNGIFIISNEGKLKYHISQRRGLSNNTALCLYEDDEKNIWVGLDNGINCINLKSPIKSYVDDSGILGTVYTSQLYNGKLYVGTNQGLFVKNFKSNDEFQFVKGTKGQVWNLFIYDNTLFCGHDYGTFIIEGAEARTVFAQSGTWKFEPVPGNKNLLLQGNYYGVSVLEKHNNQWRFRNKIKGFDYSTKYFEITDAFEIYISHEYKGVFRLETDSNLRNINKITAYKNPTKGKNASLVKFNNDIYYAYKEGVFKLNNKTKSFEKEPLLSSVFEKDDYTSGKMIVDESNRIWLFSKNYINYYSTAKLSKHLKQNSIPIPVSLTNSMLGYENITQLSASNYLFGTTDGYYTMNFKDLVFKNYKMLITNVSSNVQNGEVHDNEIKNDGQFHHDENNISINFTVPEYNKYINAEYQYILEGFQDNWSDWNVKSSVSFKNLPSGEYVFKVKAKFANSNLEQIESYTFTISKPWYGTNFAIFIYLIFLAIGVKLFLNKYNSYHKKQQEKLIEENNLLLEIKELENEQQLMRLKNEQLSQNVDEINKELAASAMHVNSKNELLAIIQEDLKNTTESGSRSIKSVISTINKNITGKDSWSVFQEAFAKTDKDFLRRIKELHPSLTPNDLKLCAYLRLNLSSKEIAPLLNISVRSVEIKRYRLRKKMDLLHEQGLVEYIISV
ncbi:LuxR family transcriptional regulator [Flavobacterium algicola]|nr:LuxR family transcriptional regulator [Flavobacterium algicola]